MPDTLFDLSRLENRNVTISWRVTGNLHGLRVRKNFKTHEEASAEKATLEIKALQAAAGLRTLVTSLTDEQAREAEAVFRRMADKSRPISKKQVFEKPAPYLRPSIIISTPTQDI